MNALANFAFLTAQCNQELSDRPPHEYFKEIEEKQPGALESQWITTDRELWRVENYREFLAARRQLLADAANRLLEELLAGEKPQGASSEEAATEASEEAPREEEATGLALVGLAASQEEDEKLELAYWAEENGLPSPHIDFIYTDAISGEGQTIFDLAWPEGLQTGLTQPVAVLFGEPSETEHVANQAGYLFFTSVEEFKTHARNYNLAEEQMIASTS